MQLRMIVGVVLALVIAATSRVWAQSPPFDALLPGPADRAWLAIADTLSSTDRVLPGGQLTFARLYRVRAMARELGLVSFDTVELGGLGAWQQVELQRLMGKGRCSGWNGVDLVAVAAQCNPLTVIRIVRLTPSMRVAPREGGMEVRLTFNVEMNSNWVGWHAGSSSGTLEGATLGAMRTRVESMAPRPTVTP